MFSYGRRLVVIVGTRRLGRSRVKFEVCLALCLYWGSVWAFTVVVVSFGSSRVRRSRKRYFF